MSDWNFLRETQADGNGWDRYYDPIAGAAVVYERVAARECFGSINGTPFRVTWPDTSAMYGGDAGRPLGYRIRPEYDGPATVTGWYLYAYIYSGGKNRTEWNVRVA